MKTEDVIESFYNSFYSLVDVVKKDIDFGSIEQHQLKGVLEGRYEAFMIASSQLNTIKDLEERKVIFNKESFTRDVSILLKSTDTILKEIKKAMDMKIEVEEIEEDKFKSVVKAKEVAGNFLLSIINIKQEMKFKLENSEVGSRNTPRNMATHKVKG